MLEEEGTHHVVREGGDLLQSADDDVLDSAILTFLQERVVHLTYLAYKIS